MKRNLIFALMLAVAALGVYAQKVKNVEGEYSYTQRDDESRDVAKKKAVDQARIVALAEAFGTVINSKSIMQTTEKKTSFMRLGENEVKGEWLGDTREPNFEYLLDTATGQCVIKVKVWGKAREIISKAVEVDAALLRNGTSREKNEDDRFYSGDQLYMYFKAPSSGYLAVYEYGNDNTVRRLIPYSRSRENSFKIEKNKEYILFSQNHIYNNERKNDIDEIVLTAADDVEGDRFCVLFCPNEFTCPIDDAGGFISGKSVGVNEAKLQLPRQLTLMNFQKWLIQNRGYDVQFRYLPIDIEIRKKH